MYYVKCLAVLLLASAVFCETLSAVQDAKSSDLATSETSAKLLNLGGIFGQGSGYPNYGYNGYNGNNGYNGYNGYNRPGSGYYPNSGYYPSYSYSGNSGFYPSSGSGYYSGSGGGYYSNSGSGYYPSSGSGYYPSSGGGYYPSTGNGYYPTTNILGSGGYGGYGGNGGLRQYSGYWQPEYSGQRNRGYGYYEQTDRFGLPTTRDRDYTRERQNYGSYAGNRGYD